MKCWDSFKRCLLMCKKKRNQFFILMMSLLPNYAFAADGDMVTKVLYNLCDYLSSKVAIGLGIIAISWTGFEMLKGHVEKEQLLLRSIGIGLAIGAGYFGKQVILGGVF